MSWPPLFFYSILKNRLILALKVSKVGSLQTILDLNRSLFKCQFNVHVLQKYLNRKRCVLLQKASERSFFALYSGDFEQYKVILSGSTLAALLKPCWPCFHSRMFKVLIFLPSHSSKISQLWFWSKFKLVQTCAQGVTYYANTKVELIHQYLGAGQSLRCNLKLPINLNIARRMTPHKCTLGNDGFIMHL